MTITPAERAAGEFAALLTRWRTRRSLSKRALARLMGFDPSYVSHIEGRRHRPTADFARRAEEALDADGEIWASYAAVEALRLAESAASPDAAPLAVPGVGVVVEREQAAVGLARGRYHAVVRLLLRNAGPDPVVRFPIRIHADCGSGLASARRFFGAPLTLADLGFSARRLVASRSGVFQPEPVRWRPACSADAAKELWLELPALPAGEKTIIEYAYHLAAGRWGTWFGRTIRFPTRELHVHLDLPAPARPIARALVGSLGTDTDLLAEQPRTSGDRQRARFAWSVAEPPLGATYRFQWRLSPPPVPAGRCGRA